MDEDDRSFGVWDRIDTSVELCVAVGYPLVDVLCHVGVGSKGSAQPPFCTDLTMNMNTLPVTYYPKSEYIETVVHLPLL